MMTRSWIVLACLGALGVTLVLGCKTSSDGGDGLTLGPCQGSPCDDGSDCTIDVCDPSDGSCSYDPLEDGAFCGDGYCEDEECEPIASTFPCSEAGIRSAIAAGGGPHGFDCRGAKLITTSEEIVIDNNVILDGRQLLLSADNEHRAFSVSEDVTAELRRFNVLDGKWQDFTEGGGCIRNLGELTILNSTVADCEALEACVPGRCVPGTGGGILNDGTMRIVNSTIERNRVTGGTLGGIDGAKGGGIRNEGTLTVEKSMIFQNSGRIGAGGIANGRGPMFLGATLTVVNSTFSGNVSLRAGTADGAGAGIGNEGTATVISCTFSENDSAVGGAIASLMGTVTVSNSILDDECDGAITSDGYNIESPGDTCQLSQSSDLSNVTLADLGITRPRDHGGPTLTHALEEDSVAIDFVPEEVCLDEIGEALETDQRSVARPQGLDCDAGAFEREQ